MLYPNGQRIFTYLARHVSGALSDAGLMRYTSSGERLNRTAGFAKTSSIPEGMAPVAVTVLPIKAGGMAGTSHIQTAGEGSLLQGGPMVGEGTTSFTTDDGNLRLIVGMSGTGSMTLTISSPTLSLTMALNGEGNIVVTGTGGLSMIVPFFGEGSMSLTGTADLKGNLSMQGEWTPYTELSPENLARAVWDAIATQFNESGTMGAKLNLASAGGVDLEALAQAILAAAQITPIHADVRAGQTGIADAVWAKALP